MGMDTRVPDGPRRRRPALLSVAAMLFASFALAACGGDDDDSSSSGEGGGGGDLGNATIGVLVPLTGELGDFGKTWEEAANLAVKQINATNAGLKLDTVVADEKTNAQVGVTEARKMISTQDVSAIVGPTSEIMVAVTPVAKREQVPVISGASGTVQLNKLGGDFIYRTVASDDSDGAAMARFLVEQDAQDVVMLVEQQGSLPSIGATIAKSFEDQGGTVKETVTFNPGQSSYRTEVGNVLQADPAWIVCACGQESGASIIKEVDASGYEGDWLLSSDNATDGTIETVGAKVVEGMYSETPSTDEDNPAYQAFVKAYKAEYGAAPELLVANVYDATMLAALAMFASGSTDGADINDALRDVANPEGTAVSDPAEAVKLLKAGEEINYEGASGPVDFDDSGTVESSYTILQAKDGEWKPIEFYPAGEEGGTAE